MRDITVSFNSHTRDSVSYHSRAIRAKGHSSSILRSVEVFQGGYCFVLFVCPFSARDAEENNQALTNSLFDT
jgi:hypothetical protein